MNFDEWLWTNKITIKSVSDATGICAATLSHIKNRRISAKLYIALALVKYSNGSIEIETLLSKKADEMLKNVNVLYTKETNNDN